MCVNVWGKKTHIYRLTICVYFSRFLLLFIFVKLWIKLSRFCLWLVLSIEFYSRLRTKIQHWFHWAHENENKFNPINTFNPCLHLFLLSFFIPSLNYFFSPHILLYWCWIIYFKAICAGNLLWNCVFWIELNSSGNGMHF